MKVKAKVLKAFHGYEEGKTYEFKQHHFNSLELRGYVEKAKTRKKKEDKE